MQWHSKRRKINKTSVFLLSLKSCLVTLQYAWASSNLICTSNHMFKKEIWDKFMELTFLKFWNLPSETRENSKFQKMSEVNFLQISRMNMWFLVNHMWKALKEHIINYYYNNNHMWLIIYQSSITSCYLHKYHLTFFNWY